MNDQEDAEELLKQSKNQRRHTTDAPAKKDRDGSESVELADAVAEVLGEIDQGDTPSNLTLRDGDLAALFAGLERSGDLDRIVQEAHDALDRDGAPDSLTRATALRLLVRVGLAEIDPSVIDAAIEGKQRYLTDQASNF